MTRRIALRALAVGLSLGVAGCATEPSQVVQYAPPAAGAAAELTVKTARMWTANRVTLYVIRDPGKSRTAEVVGQLQSGEHVRREILSFDARLPAGAPLLLNFEYRYDVGSVLERGCSVVLTTTFDAGLRYLVDFIKDANSCSLKLYRRGPGEQLTEVPVTLN